MQMDGLTLCAKSLQRFIISGITLILTLVLTTPKAHGLDGNSEESTTKELSREVLVEMMEVTDEESLVILLERDLPDAGAVLENFAYLDKVSRTSENAYDFFLNICRISLNSCEHPARQEAINRVPNTSLYGIMAGSFLLPHTHVYT